jgi:hypothetical protein
MHCRNGAGSGHLLMCRGAQLQAGEMFQEIGFALDSLLEQRRFELMVPPRTPAFRGRIPSAAVQQPGPSSHPILRWRKADPNLPCNRIRSAFVLSLSRFR